MKGKKLLGVCIFSGVIPILLLMFFYGYDATWNLWNIPTKSPCFADTRVITGGAKSRTLGYEPLVKNPGDPWGRKMNYPRIWQSLYLLGINQHHTVHLGIAFAALFLTSFFLYTARGMNALTIFVLLTSIFSPAVLLGVERGNIDLLMFFLLSVAIFFMRYRHAGKKVIATASVLFAFVLKLYPIFGMAMALREKKRTAIRLLLFTFIFAAIYTVATFSDLVLIRKATPKSTFISYGFDILWMAIGRQNPTGGKILYALSYLITFAVLAGSVYWARREKKLVFIDTGHGDRRNIDAFRVGCGVFLGTFLIGNNWDYRLMFLMFVIPQLMLWSKSSYKLISTVSIIVIICILISLWHLLIHPLGLHVARGVYLLFILDEILNWIIFLGLLFLFVSSMPKWVWDLSWFSFIKKGSPLAQ